MRSAILVIGLFLTGTALYGQFVITYAYDKQGRVTSEHVEDVYKIGFSYDAEGNFISKTVANYTDIVSIKDAQIESSVRVYPNPASDVITLESTKGEVIRRVRLADMQGRELMQTESESKVIHWNIHDLSAGMYTLTLETASGKRTVLFVKH